MDAPSSPKFRLSLLGRFELIGPDGPIDLPNKKLAGLLAYLACTAPTPQRREKLATLLWGSHFEAQARQNLRQAVFRLRRALGQDGLIGEGEEIALAPCLIDCDATRLEALIREGSQASLAEAVDLYKDRLLADVSVREETWADWVAGEQQRLEGLALGAMIRLGELELESGNPDRALAAGDRAIATDNLREEAHRLAIRALAAAGRRSDALKCYQRLAELLKRALDVEPDDITKQLIDEVRKATPPYSGIAATSSANQSHIRAPISHGTVVVVDIPRDADVNLINSAIRSVATRDGGALCDSREGGGLIEFSDARTAVQAGFDIQRQRSSVGAATREGAQLRIGVHSFSSEEQRIVAGEVAGRIATLAHPGQVVASDEVCDQLTDGLDAHIEDLGERRIDSLPAPVRAYRLNPPVAVVSHAVAAQMRPMIAVIPFDARNPGRDEDVVGEVLADETIAALSRSTELGVISRLSTRAFRGRKSGLQQISTQLGANYVLSGDYDIRGESLRVQAELAEAASGLVLWSRAFQGTINEMTGGSSELLDRLVAETSASIMSNEVARAQALPLPTLESYAILMSAINLLNRTSPSNFDRAREMLQELTVRAPHHPVPYAWLAAWHVRRLSQGWTGDPAAETQTALDCCKRALDADPNCALALSIDGHAHGFRKRFDIAASRFELALEVNPNESLAWLLKGTMHAFRGEGGIALEAAERALRLSPLDPRRSYYDSHAATAVMSAGYYERAIELSKRSLRINSLHASALRNLAIAQSLSGQLDEARLTVAALQQIDPTLTVSRWRARSPAGNFDTGKLWGEALRAAGLPE